MKPLARFVAYATAGVPPEVMGIGPVEAIPKVAATGWIEAGEYRSDRTERSVRRAVARCHSTNWVWIASKVNVNGGAIALGHPLGCTGSKLTATLLYEMQRRGCTIRHGDDVRRRRHGRGRNIRKNVKRMDNNMTKT